MDDHVLQNFVGGINVLTGEVRAKVLQVLRDDARRVENFVRSQLESVNLAVTMHYGSCQCDFEDDPPKIVASLKAHFASEIATLPA